MLVRSEGTDRSFDDLATGLNTGAITRGRAIKLAGATLVASTLGLVGAAGAEAQEVGTDAIRRRRCNRRGGDFCNNSGEAGGIFSRQCNVCCGRGRGNGNGRRRRRRRKACCGSAGCNCCRRNQRCRSNGTCD